MSYIDAYVVAVARTFSTPQLAFSTQRVAAAGLCMPNASSACRPSLSCPVTALTDVLIRRRVGVLSTDETELKFCEVARRIPKLVIRVNVHACYLHCAKSLMRSDLWNPAKHLDRSQLPSIGVMMHDQLTGKVSSETVVET